MARYAPLVPLIAGALLLIVGEFLTAREILVVTVVPPGGTRPGAASICYGLGAARARDAADGLRRRDARSAARRGGAARALDRRLLIVVFVDRPVLDDTGLIGRTYDLAEARPATGLLSREPGRRAGARGVGGDVRAAAEALALGNPARAGPALRPEMPVADAVLVRRARGGDRDAFAALVARHHATLIACCRRMVGQHARRRGPGCGAHRDAVAGPTARRRQVRRRGWSGSG